MPELLQLLPGQHHQHPRAKCGPECKSALAQPLGGLLQAVARSGCALLANKVIVSVYHMVRLCTGPWIPGAATCLSINQVICQVACSCC